MSNKERGPVFTRRSLLAAAAILPLAGSLRSQAQRGATSVLGFIPPHLHAGIRNGAGRADLTPFFRQALLAARELHVPAGLYPVTQVTIGTGRSILTDGHATRFRQLSTARRDDCVLNVEGSDVIIGDCTVEGIIDLFRAGGSEFNHGIRVYARRGAPPVRNVRIGNIRGRNLRGDVLRILCAAGAALDGVSVGDLFGDNVLRNIVAIVGGRNIAIGAIDGTACGYAALDIEPEGAYSAPVESVRVRSVRGRCCAIIANPDIYARNVTIGLLDTSPAHMTNSRPSYVDRYGQPHRLEASGLWLRNATGVEIGRHRARGHDDHAVFGIGDDRRQHSFERTLRLGQVDYAAVGRNERTHRAVVNAAGLEDVFIGGGWASMARDDQSLILGRDGATRCRIENLSANGLLARHVERSEFRGLTVDAAATRGLFQNVSRSRVVGSTLRAGYLGYNLADTVIEDSTITWLPGGPYLLAGPRRGVRLRNSSINGRRIGDQLLSGESAASLR